MFQFRLRSVQNYRQHIFKNAQALLAEVLREYQALSRQREELREELDQLETIWNEKRACGISSLEHGYYSDCLQALREKLLVLEGQISKTANQVNEAREALLIRKKEAQVLDSMEQEAKQDYRSSMSKKEQKLLDELIVIGTCHRNLDN